MPYIKDDDTLYLDAFTGKPASLRDIFKPSHIPQTPGQLNYAITMLMHEYVLAMGESYDSISEALSACHEAEQEYRRRVLVPYENKKIYENGDIFPPGTVPLP